MANTPVIIGVGEITERIRDPLQGHEPLALMEQALCAAEQDAGVPLLPLLESFDVVAEYSWLYTNAPVLLSERIDAKPVGAVYGEVGGESPVRFTHEAALCTARGE